MSRKWLCLILYIVIWSKLLNNIYFLRWRLALSFMQSLRVFFVLALLKKTAPSRIVIVASDLYKFAKLNLAKPNPTNQLPAYLYYVSKYANIMFSMELARKLKDSNTGDYSVDIPSPIICKILFSFNRCHVQLPSSRFNRLRNMEKRTVPVELWHATDRQNHV